MIAPCGLFYTVHIRTGITLKQNRDFKADLTRKGRTKMKLVLTDAQTVVDGNVNSECLKGFGEVKEYGLLSYEEVAEAVRDADIILCNKTILDGHSLRYADKLRYIGLFATGYNNIDIPFCREHGITVCNAGSYSTNAVAQHTIALILEHYSRTAQYNDFVQQGRWKTSPTFSPFVFPQSELAGKILGIVGLGAIGKAVAKIALAFEMQVIAYSRSPKSIDGVKEVSFEELLRQSDIVTAHCPLNKDSEKMFNRNSFGMMKNGALFINTARGGIMDEQALYEALQSGKLSGAGIDTLSTEPMTEDCILMKAPNCIITPHVAWAPIETRRRLMEIVCNNIKSYLSGKPENVVS